MAEIMNLGQAQLGKVFHGGSSIGQVSFMGIDRKSYITFGAQEGGIAAGQAVSPHWSDLTKLLKKHCDHRYSSEVDEFAPVLRVDGDIAHWDIEGVEKLRLARKRRYITIDIMMPRSRWQGASATDIRRYLIDNLKIAVRLMVDRLKKEHIEVDDKRLFDDFVKVEKEYLATA